MAVNYQKNGVDLDSLCEPYYCSSVSLINYQMNGSSIENRYQKASSDGFASTVSTGLYVNGTEVTPCSIGRLPTQTSFASESTSSSDITITRDSDSITIGSTTYGTSTFRNGTIPYCIGVIMCGAGGGGGGEGMNKGSKWSYTVCPGGGGGGGGIVAFVLSFVNYNSFTFNLGSGGSAGSHGATAQSSRPTSGTAGSSGSNSTIYPTSKSSSVITATGGSGGSGGVGDSDSGTIGSGGNGGSYQTSGDISDWAYNLVSVSGGKGATPNSSGGGATSCSKAFSTVDGLSPSSLFNNSETPQSYDSSSSYRASYAGGGNSIGTGGWDGSTRSGTTQTPEKGGGGGSDSNLSTEDVGANGYIEFFY